MKNWFIVLDVNSIENAIHYLLIVECTITFVSKSPNKQWCTGWVASNTSYLKIICSAIHLVDDKRKHLK